jgi:hypothetical protein
MSTSRKCGILSCWRSGTGLYISAGLTVEPEDSGPNEQFAALKHAEMIAASIASFLPPRCTPRAHDVRSSFGFEGCRAIFCEMRILCEAPTSVQLVPHKSPRIMGGAIAAQVGAMAIRDVQTQPPALSPTNSSRLGLTLVPHASSNRFSQLLDGRG